MELSWVSIGIIPNRSLVLALVSSVPSTVPIVLVHRGVVATSRASEAVLQRVGNRSLVVYIVVVPSATVVCRLLLWLIVVIILVERSLVAVEVLSVLFKWVLVIVSVCVFYIQLEIYLRGEG